MLAGVWTQARSLMAAISASLGPWIKMRQVSCSTMPLNLLQASYLCQSTLMLQQIEGWEKAILGTEDIPPIRQGGRRTVQIPASLAYGQRGLGCLFGRDNTCRQAAWLKLGCTMTWSSQSSFQGASGRRPSLPALTDYLCPLPVRLAQSPSCQAGLTANTAAGCHPAQLLRSLFSI